MFEKLNLPQAFQGFFFCSVCAKLSAGVFGKDDIFAADFTDHRSL